MTHLWALGTAVRTAPVWRSRLSWRGVVSRDILFMMRRRLVRAGQPELAPA